MLASPSWKRRLASFSASHNCSLLSEGRKVDVVYQLLVFGVRYINFDIAPTRHPSVEFCGRRCKFRANLARETGREVGVAWRPVGDYDCLLALRNTPHGRKQLVVTHPLSGDAGWGGVAAQMGGGAGFPARMGGH